jgi:hypothetical protein
MHNLSTENLRSHEFLSEFGRRHVNRVHYGLNALVEHDRAYWLRFSQDPDQDTEPELVHQAEQLDLVGLEKLQEARAHAIKALWLYVLQAAISPMPFLPQLSHTVFTES